MSNIMVDFTGFDESYMESEENFPHIYRAKRTNSFGMSVEGEFIAGLTLVIVSRGNGYDSLVENIANSWSEFSCTLPKEGLIEGAYYEANEICTSTDWETGYCDDTEVYIERVL